MIAIDSVDLLQTYIHIPSPNRSIKAEVESHDVARRRVQESSSEASGS